MSLSVYQSSLHALKMPRHFLLSERNIDKVNTLKRYFDLILTVNVYGLWSITIKMLALIYMHVTFISWYFAMKPVL